MAIMFVYKLSKRVCHSNREESGKTARSVDRCHFCLLYTSKPFLLRGARQVGKSSAIRHLGNTFKYFVEVNFERDKEIISVFTGNLKPREIASRLSAFYGIPVIPGETLLFLDEIQACPEAIHSLWFFY